MDLNKKKLTGRERRMQHFKQMQSGAGMNMVSLMDIFTILVFFLLASSSSQQLPSSRDVKLPVSVATKAPGENLVITVTKDSILVQGKKVAQIQDVMLTKETVISPLSSELKLRTANAPVAPVTPDTQAPQRTVIIMGDESIPYELLRKILATCQDAKYTQIQFAAHLQGKGKV
jgi:biopolymer transport protein TolR